MEREVRDSGGNARLRHDGDDPVGVAGILDSQLVMPPIRELNLDAVTLNPEIACALAEACPLSGLLV